MPSGRIRDESNWAVKICPNCNKQFESYKCQNRIYCSRSCIRKSKSGTKASHWKGGRRVHRGYVLIYCPDHPFCGSVHCVREHRLVMEKHLGRFLTPTERVHHINGDKADNRLENLKLFPNHSVHMKTCGHGRPKKR